MPRCERGRPRNRFGGGMHGGMDGALRHSTTRTSRSNPTGCRNETPQPDLCPSGQGWRKSQECPCRGSRCGDHRKRGLLVRPLSDITSRLADGDQMACFPSNVPFAPSTFWVYCRQSFPCRIMEELTVMRAQFIRIGTVRARLWKNLGWLWAVAPGLFFQNVQLRLLRKIYAG
jgi:hypothetical protein